jgi:two-component system response regulator YesN
MCGEAIDGNDAIEKARDLKPSLIILDLAMPQMNGAELVSVLKAILPDVRIILFTMHSEVLGCTSILSAMGFDAVLYKLDGLIRLEECVQNLLRG